MVGTIVARGDGNVQRDNGRAALAGPAPAAALERATPP